MASETPKYDVVFKEKNFEVREYSPRVVAKTIVESEFDTATKIGFKRLAGFIFGGNSKSQKIAMTTPVGMEKESTHQNNKFAITFTMPKEFSLETLPVPNDQNVKIEKEPAKTFASIRSSGTWKESTYQKHLEELKSWIKQKQFEPLGEPNFARYNPPWTLPFLRRNEILIEIKKPKI